MSNISEFQVKRENYDSDFRYKEALRGQIYREKNRDKIRFKHRLWVENNKERNKEHKQKYQNKIDKIIDSYRDKPCKICRKKYPVVCMDFHHRDPSTKVKAVMEMRSTHSNLQSVLDEIKKCDVICANCHIRINGFPKYYPKWFLEYLKTLKCNKCSTNMSIEFHHKDPKTKFMEVTTMAKYHKSEKSIMNEIKKCDILCRNCHRLQHKKSKK